MNLIANPIGPHVSGNPLQAIIIERHERQDFINLGPGPAFHTTRDKLELVYYGQIKLAYCNTDSRSANPTCSLTSTRQRIAETEIDLVVTRDLRQISDWFDEVLSFVRHCVERGTRVIAFDDKFDSADPDWEQSLFGDLFDDLGSSGCSENPRRE